MGRKSLGEGRISCFIPSYLPVKQLLEQRDVDQDDVKEQAALTFHFP
jgi:hypothetical protein